MNQTVRFALPFPTWCCGCLKLLGKGSRFNATKKSVIGEYLNLNVFTFSIKCPFCSSEIMYQTDPKSCSYKIIGFGGKEKITTSHSMKEDISGGESFSIFTKMEERFEKEEKLKNEGNKIDKILKNDKEKSQIPEFKRRMNARKELRKRKNDVNNNSIINGPENEEDIIYARNLFS